MAGNNLVDYATEHLIEIMAFGDAPNSHVIIPFGRLDDPGDMFPAQEFNKLDLKMVGESGAGQVRVCSVRLRT